MANPAQSTAPVSKTGETLTVACKLPNGIVMQLYDMVDKRYDRPDGTTREVREAMVRPGAIKLNGAAKFRGGGKEMPQDFAGGAGLTYGVPVDMFSAWMEAHKDDEYVKAGMIFAHRRDTHGQTREHVGVVTGLEPTDPRNLPAEFKRTVQTASGI